MVPRYRTQHSVSGQSACCPREALRTALPEPKDARLAPAPAAVRRRGAAHPPISADESSHAGGRRRPRGGGRPHRRRLRQHGAGHGHRCAADPHTPQNMAPSCPSAAAALLSVPPRRAARPASGSSAPPDPPKPPAAEDASAPAASASTSTSAGQRAPSPQVTPLQLQRARSHANLPPVLLHITVPHLTSLAGRRRHLWMPLQRPAAAEDQFPPRLLRGPLPVV